METFLSKAIEESGITKADIAKATGRTRQALHTVVIYPTPKPDTVMQILRAIGWSDEQIGALKFSDVYDLTVNGAASPPG